MNKQLLRDALRCTLKWTPSMNGLSAEGVLINRLQEAIDAQKQPIHGWMTDGSSRVTFGAFAEQDTKAEAKRCGGTCKAYPIYRGPQPVADLADDKIIAAWNGLQERKRSEAPQFIKDKTGSVCGVCGVGELYQDSNGYNSFMRCNKCSHVPLYINGQDVHSVLSAQKAKQCT